MSTDITARAFFINFVEKISFRLRIAPHPSYGYEHSEAEDDSPPPISNPVYAGQSQNPVELLKNYPSVEYF